MSRIYIVVNMCNARKCGLFFIYLLADPFVELYTDTANMHNVHFSPFHYVFIIITLKKRVIFDSFAFPVYCCSWLLSFTALLVVGSSMNSYQLILYLFALHVSDLQNHSKKAAVNVNFLSLLKEPCEELARLRPSEVAPKMKRIINLIYTVWANNQHYSSNERISDLFLMVPACLCIYYFIPSNNTTFKSGRWLKYGKKLFTSVSWLSFTGY